jgi:hypothetical protein
MPLTACTRAVRAYDARENSEASRLGGMNARGRSTYMPVIKRAAARRHRCMHALRLPPDCLPPDRGPELAAFGREPTTGTNRYPRPPALCSCVRRSISVHAATMQTRALGCTGVSRADQPPKQHHHAHRLPELHREAPVPLRLA